MYVLAYHFTLFVHVYIGHIILSINYSIISYNWDALNYYGGAELNFVRTPKKEKVQHQGT